MSVSFFIAQPNRHMLSNHSEHEAIAAMKNSSNETKVKKEKELGNNLLSTHVLSVATATATAVAAPPHTQTKIGGIDSFFAITSWLDFALCQQAHWFLYSPSSQPISTFRDDCYSYSSMMAVSL